MGQQGRAIITSSRRVEHVRDGSEKAFNQMWDEITTEYHDEQNETVRNVGFLAARAGRLMI